MADKPLQSITFPGLTDKYTIPAVDNTLSVTGAAADAKKTGDELTDLKADLNNQGISTLNNTLWVNGKIVTTSGAFSGTNIRSLLDNPARCKSDIFRYKGTASFKITDGFQFLLYRQSGTNDGAYIDTYYDEKTYTFDDTYFYRFLIKKADGSNISPDDFVLNGFMPDSLYTQIIPYTANIENITSIYPLTINGFINASGVITANENFKTSDYIPCTGTKKIQLYGKIGYIQNTSYSNINAYAPDKSFIGTVWRSESSSQIQNAIITLPDNTAFIRITSNLACLDTFSVFFDAGKILADVPNNNGIMSYIRKTSDTLSNNQNIVLGKNSVKTNKRMAFTANIVTMGEIRFFHGDSGNYMGNWVSVDDTYIKIYKYGNSNPIKSVEHGLTFVNNIQVHISTDNLKNATITVYADGNSYETSISNDWDGSNGNIYCKAVSASLTDCVLSWTCDGFNSDIHVYGDSYIGLYEGRWPYYLMQDGYGNDCLFNGYGGESSSSDLADAKMIFDHSIPRYILWLPGMNDPDTSSAVNTTWKSSYDDIVSIAKELHAELILATIPCVPDRNHTFKNAIVRESGYRYIDFAVAVGGEEAGSTWYSGMLSSDNVHPTANGGRALYMQVLADFPEIMIN